MGTWAEGNYANDGALDYVGDLIYQLTNTINECFEENNADLDEGGESMVVPSVDIIRVLSQHCGAAPPTPAVVQEWQRRYLKIYDDQIDGLIPSGTFKTDRREVIVKTFADLLTHSEKFHKR